MYTLGFNWIADRTVLIKAMQAYFLAILFGPQSTPETASPLAAT